MQVPPYYTKLHSEHCKLVRDDPTHEPLCACKRPLADHIVDVEKAKVALIQDAEEACKRGVMALSATYSFLRRLQSYYGSEVDYKKDYPEGMLAKLRAQFGASVGCSGRSMSEAEMMSCDCPASHYRLDNYYELFSYDRDGMTEE